MTTSLATRSSRERSVKRLIQVAAIAAAGVISLTACGSDPATGTGNSAQSGGSASGGSASGSASGASLACPSGKLNAEGSTAQANAITQAISAYSSSCSNKSTIEYNATGSGDGIKNFTGGLVDFAGSDAALDDDEAKAAEKRCNGNPAWNLPMVAGPVSLVYNVDGVDKLVLTPKVSSEIFTGKIKKWNDPEIAKLNSGAKLPDEKITVFFRSDESGTTQNVENFLKEAGEGAWTKEPSKSWGGVGEGKNKSSGIAQSIGQTKNSISYVEWSYAKNSSLTMAQLDNGNGPVELTADSVGKAVSGAKVIGEGNDLKLQLKYSGTEAGAYPLLLVTYEIVCSKGLDADKTKLEKDFLSYMASADSQKSLEQLGYAPLPDELQKKVSAAAEAIQ